MSVLSAGSLCESMANRVLCAPIMKPVRLERSTFALTVPDIAVLLLPRYAVTVTGRSFKPMQHENSELARF